MPKLAPKNDQGLTPYVLTETRDGQLSDAVFYAANGSDAAAQSSATMNQGDYVSDVRRASPAHIAACSPIA